MASTSPGFSLLPSAATNSEIWPGSCASNVTSAKSVSMSHSGVPRPNGSPIFTCHLDTVPSFIVSKNLGNLMLSKYTSLNGTAGVAGATGLLLGEGVEADVLETDLGFSEVALDAGAAGFIGVDVDADVGVGVCECEEDGAEADVADIEGSDERRVALEVGDTDEPTGEGVEGGGAGASDFRG